MATNYFKNIYDKVISLIQADSNFDMLVGKRAPFLRDVLMSKDFAVEFGIMLTPIIDDVVEQRTPGQEDAHTIDLTYFRKIPREIDYDVLTQAAENLADIWKDNRHPTDNEWHHIYPESTVFTLELPDEETGKDYYGFVQRIIALKGKYA